MGLRRTTTERGLGADHQRRRRATAKPQGDPCPYCGQPMWPDMRLDLDHVVLRALGGAEGPVRWAHSRCNRQAGGKVSSQFKVSSKVRSRKWLR